MNKASPKKKTVTKKVNPYPISATVEANSIKKPFEIILLTLKGVIGRMDKTLVYVGEHCSVEFTVPVLHHTIIARVRVMRTFDKVVNPQAKIVDRMAEFHFENLDPRTKSRIEEFLDALKPKEY